MPVQVNCPGCRSLIVLGEELCGKTVRCSRCQQVFRVGGTPPRAAQSALPPAVTASSPPAVPAPSEAVSPAVPAVPSGSSPSLALRLKPLLMTANDLRRRRPVAALVAALAAALLALVLGTWLLLPGQRPGPAELAAVGSSANGLEEEDKAPPPPTRETPA